MTESEQVWQDAVVLSTVKGLLGFARIVRGINQIKAWWSNETALYRKPARPLPLHRERRQMLYRHSPDA